MYVYDPKCINDLNVDIYEEHDQKVDRQNQI